MAIERLTVGVLVFPDITQLDATAPCEVFANLPNTDLRLIAKEPAPITTAWGLSFRPSATYENSPELDVLCVPGASA